MKNFYSILILAKLNASEWIRLKFFHVIVFFGVIFFAFSHLLSSLTFSVQERLLYDFGLAGIEIGLIMISSLIGSHSIQREIDRKTLFVLLSRPIPRSNVILGFWLSIIVLCVLFCGGFLISLIISSGAVKNGSSLILASFSSLIKAMVISSFAIAFGLLVRPILALGATFCYWILCYSITDVEFFVTKLKDENLTNTIKTIKYFLPQFYNYNWKSYYYMLNPPLASEVGWAVFHSLGWTCIWLFVAIQLFRRKEIV